MKAPSQKITAGALFAIASCLTCLAPAQEDRRNSPASSTAFPDLTQGVLIASMGFEHHGVRHYDGQKLLNTEGAELGTIKDLIVDPQASRVRYLVVSSGGLGGMGNKLRLVPVETVRRSNRGLEVNILKAAWLEVPPVSDANYVVDRFEISPAQHQIMVQQFRSPGSGARPVDVSPSTPAAQGGQVVSGLLRASALRGKDARIGTQPVGEIKDVIVDLERGTAAALLESAGEFTGTAAKYIVPLSRFTLETAKQNPIGTTLTRADFDRAQPAHFGSIGATAAQETRAAGEQPLAPTGRTTAADAAGQSSDALAVSARTIRNAILDDPTLGAERVQVTTVSGGIVLSGSVRNETSRNKIEDVARRAVTTANIDNRITVENR